jgi:small subunit ribosomal protein S21
MAENRNTRKCVGLSFVLHILHVAQARGLAELQLHDGESLESALKRFKRKVPQEDIIKEIKRHAFYLKPGQKKRLKQALARKRARKKRPRDG